MMEIIGPSKIEYLNYPAQKRRGLDAEQRELFSVFFSALVFNVVDDDIFVAVG